MTAKVNKVTKAFPKQYLHDVMFEDCDDPKKFGVLVEERIVGMRGRSGIYEMVFQEPEQLETDIAWRVRLSRGDNEYAPDEVEATQVRKRAMVAWAESDGPDVIDLDQEALWDISAKAESEGDIEYYINNYCDPERIKPGDKKLQRIVAAYRAASEELRAYLALNEDPECWDDEDEDNEDGPGEEL